MDTNTLIAWCRKKAESCRRIVASGGEPEEVREVLIIDAEHFEAAALKLEAIMWQEAQR